MHASSKRARLRDLGIVIGHFPTGPNNAITDVEGVLVGHKTVIRDTPAVVRTGVTVIRPRNGAVHEDFPFAGFFSFNGNGEMTGISLIEEWGLLTSPIVLTNTAQVGTGHAAIVRYGAHMYDGLAYKIPVVAETYDGRLSDMDSFPLREEDFIEALESASAGPVSEGNVGGGTGMISYEFKAGIGTSSRQVDAAGTVYTVGVLVQTNHGSRHMFRVNGVAVGQVLDTHKIPSPYITAEVAAGKAIPETEGSSIIAILATDAPLLPHHCRRLAMRATIGMARTGGVGYNSSGDLFLAFSTGNHYDPRGRDLISLDVLHHGAMDPLIEASAEAVEEAILNALTAAETMQGYKGHTAHAVPLDRLVEIVRC